MATDKLFDDEDMFRTGSIFGSAVISVLICVIIDAVLYHGTAIPNWIGYLAVALWLFGVIAWRLRRII